MNREIDKLKARLNDMIISGGNHKEIYRLSVEIDKLIAKFYTSSEYGRNTYTDLYYRNS